ncbi:hypothetical protein Adt_33146 [Abeliophyllum distichum]|uniref:Uncharacterized protein n=1 Tax=Abeliophyllum distichum TaxID=126358 RepID=A0ABD1QVF1_9LAMI
MSSGGLRVAPVSPSAATATTTATACDGHDRGRLVGEETRVSFACWALYLPTIAVGQSDLHGLGTSVAYNGKEAKVVACRYHDKTQYKSVPYRASSLAAVEVEAKLV